jgi:hypothetical protein
MRPHMVLTDGRQQQHNHNTTTYCVYWQKTINPIIIRPHIVFTDIGLLLSSVSKHNMWSYYDWVYCLLSVNTICGRIMIVLSFSSVSKHNMWSYYDWVVVVFVPSVNTICGRIMIGLSNDNPIIARPHIVFTDGRQRQPIHNTTAYCGYWWTTTTTTQTQYVVVLWLGFRCCRPSVNTICGRIMIGLALLSSSSHHKMWSYYDWVYCCCPSVKTICGRIMITQS